MGEKSTEEKDIAGIVESRYGSINEMSKGRIDFYINAEKRNIEQLERCIDMIQHCLTQKRKEIAWLESEKNKR